MSKLCFEHAVVGKGHGGISVRAVVDVTTMDPLRKTNRTLIDRKDERSVDIYVAKPYDKLTTAITESGLVTAIVSSLSATSQKFAVLVIGRETKNQAQHCKLDSIRKISAAKTTPDHRQQFLIRESLLIYVGSAALGVPLVAMKLGFVPPLFGRPVIQTSAAQRRVSYRTPRMSGGAGSLPSVSSSSLGVVISGSTKGVGRALAEEFVKQNDGVVISSRTPDSVDSTVASLRRRYPTARVFGCVADVSKHLDVARLADFASENLGTVNTFICNAGTTGARGPIRDAEADDLANVVSTNLLGPMLCAKEAWRVAQNQSQPLHVFIMDGSGSRGNTTPNYAAYGATKRSIPQLVASLAIEGKDDPVRFHTLSPGMVLTDLLLAENQEPIARKVFNFLAEEPETVAENLVPRIRSVVRSDKSKTYIQFLTIPKAFFQLAAGFVLGLRGNKFFDNKTGQRIAQTGHFKRNGVRIKED